MFVQLVGVHIGAYTRDKSQPIPAQCALHRVREARKATSPKKLMLEWGIAMKGQLHHQIVLPLGVAPQKGKALARHKLVCMGV